MIILAYTDGSCHYVDRIGGYAWKVIDEANQEYLGGGSDHDTTISRMELMGCIGALDYIYDNYGPSFVLLHSDSEYVVKGFTNKSRKRNKNVDLWLWLEELEKKHTQVWMEHVKGHAGHTDNEDCDMLAGEFRLAAKSEDNTTQ